MKCAHSFSLTCKLSALIVTALCAVSVLAACAPSGYVSPYNWEDLQRQGEKLVYAPEGVVESRWGVDVSAHQHSIDWQQVADAGVQFAFVRLGNRGATEGVLYEDEFFMANATGAHQAGIPVSAYFFSQAISEDEVQAEADLALSLLAKAEAEGVRFEAVAFDHEAVDVEGARANDLDGDTLSAFAISFCERMERAGYEPLVYGNQRDLGKLHRVIHSAYLLWLAEYEVGAPTAQFDFILWQYSNAGSIPGIPTEVDLNIWLPLPKAP